MGEKVWLIRGGKHKTTDSVAAPACDFAEFRKIELSPTEETEEADTLLSTMELQ